MASMSGPQADVDLPHRMASTRDHERVTLASCREDPEQQARLVMQLSSSTPHQLRAAQQGDGAWRHVVGCEQLVVAW